MLSVKECCRLLILLNMLWSTAAPAAQHFSLPIFIRYDFMQQMMLREMFKAPGHAATYPLDDFGCGTVSFTQPHLSGNTGLMQVRANVLLKFGMRDDAKKCSALKQWSGSTAIQGKPLITGADGLTVHFKVMNAEVFDANGKQLNNGLIKMALEGQLHPLLDQFKVDLKPRLKQLTSALPFRLLGYSTQQIEHLMTGVRLGNIQVGNNGLNIAVQMASDKQALFTLLPILP